MTLELERRAAIRDSMGVAIATGAYGISFGALATANGLSVLQAQVLSLLMFSGASQFAMVGILGAGGSTISAVMATAMLGSRNGLYGLRVAPLLKVRGWRRVVAAQVTIDESTAMALSRDENAHDGAIARTAFWAAGLGVFVLWNLATLLGSVGAQALGDPRAFGLDAAIPAGFIALVWPRLRGRQAWAVAASASLVALALTPAVRPGVPVLAAAAVAIIAGLVAGRFGHRHDGMRT
jgi:predicted branched-subunit amino acid permease